MTVVSGRKHFIGSGWAAVAHDLGLKVGDQVRLQPISRDPWRLRLTLLPPDSGAPVKLEP